MRTLRNSLLGAGLALPLAAFAVHAQVVQPDGGRTITVPPGAIVLILPAAGTVAASNMVNADAPDLNPMLQLIARQQADMQRMVADMNAAFPPMPDPGAMLRAAFGAGVPLNISVMPLADGHGVCSQSISVVDRGDGSAPIVHVSQTGDACGGPGVGQPRGVDEMRHTAPVQPPHGPKVLEIGYPPHPVTTGTPPRT